MPLRAVIRLYVEVFRGLPILVTVFATHFLLPTISPQLEFDRRSPAGTIALTLWGSAQVAEATRGAVQSIPREQRDAAAALGFGWVGSHAFVILPQALRRLLPPLVSLLVNIIQNTTLVGVIGGLDILYAGSTARTSGSRRSRRSASARVTPSRSTVAVAALFFLISFPLARLAAYLEKRLVV